MLRTFALTLPCLLALTGAASAQPANIIFIRHGEKPADEKDTGLAWQGQARAAALVPYFLKNPDMKAYGMPTALFAQSIPVGHSQRPYLTLLPYAKETSLAIDLTWDSADYPKLVKVLMDPDGKLKGKTVLVCWEHNNLALMAALLEQQLENKGVKVKGAPKKWEWPGPKVYGRTWVFSLDADGKACTFQDLAQSLMFDDAKHN